MDVASLRKRHAMAVRTLERSPLCPRGGGVAGMAGEERGERLLGLERKGTHNLNFVPPTPHAPQLIGAVAAAREKGFALPVVYNSNGYDSPGALALLEGVVDIYLPDVKYVSPRLAGGVSARRDYHAP